MVQLTGDVLQRDVTEMIQQGEIRIIDAGSVEGCFLLGDTDNRKGDGQADMVIGLELSAIEKEFMMKGEGLIDDIFFLQREFLDEGLVDDDLRKGIHPVTFLQPQRILQDGRIEEDALRISVHLDFVDGRNEVIQGVIGLLQSKKGEDFVIWQGVPLQMQASAICHFLFHAQRERLIGIIFLQKGIQAVIHMEGQIESEIDENEVEG